MNFFKFVSDTFNDTLATVNDTFASVNDALNDALNVQQPQSSQDVFKGHWDKINLYYNSDPVDASEAKTKTELEFHLNSMIKYLSEEDNQSRQRNDKDASTDSINNSMHTGPCLEFLLEHRIPEHLVMWAKSDIPSGMRVMTLSFFTSLFSSISQPLLPENSIRAPLQQLLSLCSRLNERDNEAFSSTYLQWMQLNVEVLKKVVEVPSMLPLIFENPSTVGDIRFPIMVSLLEHMDMEGPTGGLARNGVLLVAQLIDTEPQLGDYLIHHALAAPLIAVKLAELHLALPSYIGLSLKSSPRRVPSSGSNSSEVDMFGPLLSHFLEFLCFADHVVDLTDSHKFGQALCDAIYQKLLNSVVQDSFLQQVERGAIAATWYTTYGLREIQSKKLVRTFERFIVGELNSAEFSPVFSELLRRIEGMSEPLSAASLALLEAVFDLYDRDVLIPLILSQSLIDEKVEDKPDAAHHLEAMRDSTNKWLTLLPWPTPAADIDSNNSATDKNEIGFADQLTLDDYMSEAQDSQQTCIEKWQSWGFSNTEKDNYEANGPVLSLLIENIGHLPDLSFEKALLLTSCLIKLAHCPWPSSLQKTLLDTSNTHPRSLYSVLRVAAQTISARCARVSGFGSKVNLLKRREPHSLGPDEERLLLAFIVLSEFTKELAATLMVKSTGLLENLYSSTEEAEQL